MRRRINSALAAVVAAALLLTLSGCSLARTDEAASGGEDRLIGAFLTADYLDLFDFESYFNDHANQLLGDGDVVIDDTSGYQNRIYARRVETLRTDPEYGDSWTDVEFVFDLEGYGVFAPTYSSGNTTVVGSFSDGEGLDEVYFDFAETGVQIEATLYIPTRGEVPLTAEELDDEQLESNTWYINPVYQTAAGEVYLTGGQGIGFSGAMMGTMTQTLTETHAVTDENGETREQTCSVTIHITGVHAPASVEIQEMSDERGLLRSETYAPDSVPEDIVPGAETDYLVVLTRAEDGAVTREIYDREAEGFRTLAAGQEVCPVLWHGIDWPE